MMSSRSAGLEMLSEMSDTKRIFSPEIVRNGLNESMITNGRVIAAKKMAMKMPNPVIQCVTAKAIVDDAKTKTIGVRPYRIFKTVETCSFIGSQTSS